ncbi:ADP-ribosylation factor family [Powellomyces hirtus]|nr:ADP-ribosylation factor family [Powellomyces hirtus]
MGIWTTFLTNLGFLRKKVSILILGLDNSGKTTLVAHFLHPPAAGTAGGEPAPPAVVPTVGFSLDRFNWGNLGITVFDMSGQGRYRDFWEHFYGDADGILWVLDSSDSARISVAHDELWRTIGHKDLQRTKPPILIFANKSDVPGCMTPEQCTAALGLDTIRDRNWNMIPSNAITGEGLAKGLDWLAAELSTTS